MKGLMEGNRDTYGKVNRRPSITNRLLATKVIVLIDFWRNRVSPIPRVQTHGKVGEVSKRGCIRVGEYREEITDAEIKGRTFQAFRKALAMVSVHFERDT